MNSKIAFKIFYHHALDDLGFCKLGMGGRKEITAELGFEKCKSRYLRKDFVMCGNM